MLDNLLINCCAPTLASLKSGSLFTCKHGSDCDSVLESVSEWNERLAACGIRMCVLRMTEQSALIYVYRETSLARNLSDPEVQSFLESYGYDVCLCCDGCDESGSASCSIAACIEHLKRRVADEKSDFPHEIGIFLDYPLADVKGFIENKGRDFKLVGNWKVYGDEDHARKRFASFSKCTSVYNKLWASGRRSVLQLTVAG